MAKIDIDPDIVQAKAADAATAAAEAQDALSTLTSKLSELDSMAGQWLTGFQGLFDEQYTPQATALVQTLEGLDQFLAGAAQSFGEVDASFAG